MVLEDSTRAFPSATFTHLPFQRAGHGPARVTSKKRDPYLKCCRLAARVRGSPHGSRTDYGTGNFPHRNQSNESWMDIIVSIHASTKNNLEES